MQNLRKSYLKYANFNFVSFWRTLIKWILQKFNFSYFLNGSFIGWRQRNWVFDGQSAKLPAQQREHSTLNPPLAGSRHLAIVRHNNSGDTGVDNNIVLLQLLLTDRTITTFNQFSCLPRNPDLRRGVYVRVLRKRELRPPFVSLELNLCWRNPKKQR